MKGCRRGSHRPPRLVCDTCILPLLSGWANHPLDKRDAAASASKRPKIEPGSSVVVGANAPLPKAHAQLSKSALWLERSKSLLVSGRVWDVAKLATDYKVPVASKCWEYLLNGRTGENKALVCPSPGRPGHGSPTDAAHVLEGFDRDSALDKYSVPATPPQRQRLAKIMAEVGRAGGREMCDFGDADDSLTVASRQRHANVPLDVRSVATRLPPIGCRRSRSKLLGGYARGRQQHPGRQCSKRSHGPGDGRRGRLLLEAVRRG